jgi:GNAT superfamily N-acetyltransferase
VSRLGPAWGISSGGSLRATVLGIGPDSRSGPTDAPLSVGLRRGLGSLLFVTSDVDTRPVGPKDVPDLTRLFETQRTTRRCWCMAFCATRSQFAVGWLNGGNQRRFETLAAASSTPMGILASQAGEPVGWCACGPRSRYVAATSPRSKIMRNRARDEDQIVWLLACLFVRDGHRGQGVTHALVRAAVELARREGASAIEGWPLAGSERRSDDAFLGREQVFEDLGFSCIEQPSPERVIMRLELSGTA